MDKNSAILIDHYKNPRYRGVIASPDVMQEVVNRTCGDRVAFTARMEQGVIRDIRFEGEGCFYCLASASIVCNNVTGCRITRVKSLTKQVRNWLHKDGPSPAGKPEISALGEIKKYPMRIACVDLAWKGLEEMLDQAERQ